MAHVIDQEKMFDTTMQMITTASQLPFVRVNREEFLRKQFQDNPHLDVILEKGPQAVYTVQSLEKKADRIINNMTNQVAAGAFLLGVPANPLLAVPLAGADVAQFFGFALHLAQQLAYLYGEDDLFSGAENELTEEAKIRVVVYLGAMFGTAGAGALLPKVAKKAGENIGKKVFQKALTRTAWYPIVKKIGAAVGVQITKKTVQKGIEKFVPLVGGVIGGGLTYAMFKPMGKKLSKTFAAELSGGFVDDMELSPEFLAQLNQALDEEIEDAEFTEKV